MTHPQPIQTPAMRRYVWRTLGFMCAYVGVGVGTMFAGADGWPAPFGWLAAAMISLPIAGQMWATLALIRGSDEFVRAVTAKQFILAAGLAMTLFSAWGFAETYATAPHAPGWLIYPLFWAMFGLMSPFVRSSR